MVRCVVVLFLLLSFTCSGQDSLSLGELSRGIEFMKSNLVKSHTEFRTGVVFSAVGATAVFLGAFWATPDPVPFSEEKSQSPLKDPLLISGSILALTGAIIMIDSHRYIYLAGHWRISGSGIVVDF